MNTNEFETLVEKRKNGITPGFGWGTYIVRCPACGDETIRVAMCYTKGYSCLDCGYQDEAYPWLPSEECVKCDGPRLAPVGWEGADLITPN